MRQMGMVTRGFLRMSLMGKGQSLFGLREREEEYIFMREWCISMNFEWIEKSSSMFIFDWYSFILDEYQICFFTSSFFGSFLKLSSSQMPMIAYRYQIKTQILNCRSVPIDYIYTKIASSSLTKISFILILSKPLKTISRAFTNSFIMSNFIAALQ